MLKNLFPKNKIERDHSVTKSFNFKKGGTTLAFVLRTDTKDELISFEALLVEALAEVREEIDQ